MLTQDPIGLAGGINLYSYAGNNPVSFDDPYGLCPARLSWGKSLLCNAIEATSTALGGLVGCVVGCTAGAAATAGTGGLALPAAIGASEVAIGSGLAVGLAAGKALTGALFSEGEGNGAGGGEAKPQKQPGETANFNHAVRKLGLNRTDASKALHEMKRAAGLRGADNVWINTETGAVRAQVNGEVIGNLLP